MISLPVQVDSTAMSLRSAYCVYLYITGACDQFTCAGGQHCNLHVEFICILQVHVISLPVQVDSTAMSL